MLSHSFFCFGKILIAAFAARVEESGALYIQDFGPLSWWEMY